MAMLENSGRALSVPLSFAEVAQLVERGPEKAGVGGSIPSLGIPGSDLRGPLNPLYGASLP